MIVSIVQLDLFCLRERDLFGRYANEVSQYQAQGETKEKAVLLVDTRHLNCFVSFIAFLLLILLNLLNVSELSTRRRFGKGLR